MRIKDRMAILEPRDYGKVLEIAYRLNTTYYDAAAENKLILVADDKKLHNKVKERRRIIEEVFGAKLEARSTEELLLNLYSIRGIVNTFTSNSTPVAII